MVLTKLQLPLVAAPRQSTSNLQDWWISISNTLHAPMIVKRWRSVALLCWWMLWKERNNRIFNQSARNPQVLGEKIISEFRLWRSAGLLGTVWPEGE